MKSIPPIALWSTWLAAIIVANFSSAHYGPDASIVNAVLFIGLTLTTRDKLHDLWGDKVMRNMAALILVGSGISYLSALAFASDELPSSVVAQIALASCLALAAAETVDALVYQRLCDKPWLERASSSNVVSATVDSVVFVAVAFDGFLWQVALAQACAKVAGGYIYALALRRAGREPETVTA